MAFDPSTSLLAGVDNATAQQWLTQAQAAYVSMQMGRLEASVTYSTPDGMQSVTYAKGDVGALALLIRQLQAQLGLVVTRRRAIGINFR